MVHGPAHRGASGSVAPKSEKTTKAAAFSLSTPRGGGLRRRLGTRRAELLLLLSLGPIPPGARKYWTPGLWLVASATHAHPTSPRSTGFCAIWGCISSSSLALRGVPCSRAGVHPAPGATTRQSKGERAHRNFEIQNTQHLKDQSTTLPKAVKAKEIHIDGGVNDGLFPFGRERARRRMG